MATGTILKYADGTDSQLQPITASTFNGTIYVRQIGKIVMVYATNITLKTDLSGQSLYRSLGTLFADYSPASVISFWAGSLTKMGQIRIAPGGVTNFFRPNATETWSTSDNITFSGMYIAA